MSIREDACEFFTVNLLVVGPFGRAVARYFREFEPRALCAEVSPNDAPPIEACGHARVNVVIAWRPVPDLCDYLDLISRQNRQFFVPLVMESAVLRLGPVITPEEGGCWPCWTKRAGQHTTSIDDHAAVMNYYSMHPFSGPRGYLEPYAMLAAVKIKQTVDSLPSVPAGYIWQLDTITRHILTGVMLGLHNCPRCGLHRDESTRSTSELERHMSFLWKSRR
jgi:hypothetical protein